MDIVCVLKVKSFLRLACSYFLFVSCSISVDMRNENTNIQGHTIVGGTVIQLSVNKA